MKKHQILKDTEAALEGLDQTSEVEVGNRKFKLRLLTRQDETRARSLVTGDNILSAFADSNVPQLAHAITHINDYPVGELFTPETDEERSACEADEHRWVTLQMLDWLNLRPTLIVEQLWLGYLELKARVEEALKDLENFSKRTPSGG